MTRKEKVNALEWYCDRCGDTCDKCELKNIIVDMNRTEDSSVKELEEFYTKVAIWSKVLEE